MRQLSIFDVLDKVQSQYPSAKESLLEKQSNISPNITAYNSSVLCQWNTIKKEYPDAILLFRTGDLYMIYNEDAHICAPILHLTIHKTGIEHIYFPYTNLDNFLPLLVRAGHKVAICDQVQKPIKNIKQKIIK